MCFGKSGSWSPEPLVRLGHVWFSMGFIIYWSQQTADGTWSAICSRYFWSLPFWWLKSSGFIGKLSLNKMFCREKVFLFESWRWKSRIKPNALIWQKTSSSAFVSLFCRFYQAFENALVAITKLSAWYRKRKYIPDYIWKTAGKYLSGIHWELGLQIPSWNKWWLCNPGCYDCVWPETLKRRCLFWRA